MVTGDRVNKELDGRKVRPFSMPFFYRGWRSPPLEKLKFLKRKREDTHPIPWQPPS